MPRSIFSVLHSAVFGHTPCRRMPVRSSAGEFRFPAVSNEYGEAARTAGPRAGVGSPPVIPSERSSRERVDQSHVFLKIAVEIVSAAKGGWQHMTQRLLHCEVMNNALSLEFMSIVSLIIPVFP